MAASGKGSAQRWGPPQQHPPTPPPAVRTRLPPSPRRPAPLAAWPNRGGRTSRGASPPARACCSATAPGARERPSPATEPARNAGRCPPPSPPPAGPRREAQATATGDPRRFLGPRSKPSSSRRT
ncbi:basic proline-rich protein-like [Neopsephotus bourkii]|uniref:basic proline-rich protein-like n=1 Tax=Neopsephotus bourkii TaxID=309878 RepID=UPI002AA5A865|nr:basic proline-rich protein-like [Neopsephotus bourkii]